MLENIDPSTVLALLSLFATVAMQLIGFGKIIGQINIKLSVHDENLIRQQTRIDEHAKIINDHDRDLAILKDRRERGEEYWLK